jgi:hypothetical protein
MDVDVDMAGSSSSNSFSFASRICNASDNERGAGIVSAGNALVTCSFAVQRMKRTIKEHKLLILLSRCSC